MGAGFDDAGVHATMLLDPVRVEAFARAIRAVVKPGSVVVDVGSGSGVLALLAARAGARKVYAIERGPMFELLVRTIEENGATGVVEPMYLDARDAEFAEPPDVVVSETLGSLGIDEDCLSLLMAVKSQCTPDCVMVPSAVEVVLALVADPALDGRRDALAPLGDLGGLKFTTVRDRVTERFLLGQLSADAVLSSEVSERFVIGVDRAPASVSGTCTVHRAGVVNGLAGWFRSDLAPGLPLSNGPDAPRTCWATFSFPLDRPLEVAPGDRVKLQLKPRVVNQPATWSWQVRRGAEVRGGDSLPARPTRRRQA